MLSEVILTTCRDAYKRIKKKWGGQLTRNWHLSEMLYMCLCRTDRYGTIMVFVVNCRMAKTMKWLNGFPECMKVKRSISVVFGLYF